MANSFSDFFLHNVEGTVYPVLKHLLCNKSNYPPYSTIAAILVFFVYLQITPCCLVLKLEIQLNIFP